MQKGFIFDVNKCTGCEACQIACVIENEVDPQVNWRRVYTFNPILYPGLPHFHHSLACNHCVDPPCMKHCPTVACSKDPDTGAVTIDPDLCIGCRYCSWVCPFDAPQFNHATGVMEKCTFCQHRLEEGEEPACAALCPTDALRFGDYEEQGDGGGPVPGFTPTDVGPAIRFVPLREGQTQPVCSVVPDSAYFSDIPREATLGTGPRITLKSEWPLVVFTLFLAALAGWTAAASLTSAAIDRLAFLGTAVVTVALGVLHLGDKPRAYRAVLGWRDSWLSREIILVVLFLISSAAYVLFAPANRSIGLTASLIGLAALFTVDQVYHVAGPQKLHAHSARVVLIGFYLFGIFSGNAVVFGVMLILRSLLYWRRKSRLLGQHKDARPMLSLARIVLGFVVPVALWNSLSGQLSMAMIISVLAGELIDRCEYYLELDFPTPSKQMALDFTAELQRRYDMPS